MNGKASSTEPTGKNGTDSKKGSNDEKPMKPEVIALIVVIVIIFAAWIAAFVAMYFTQTGIFEPYSHTTSNGLVKVNQTQEPLTEEQQLRKQEMIEKAQFENETKVTN